MRGWAVAHPPEYALLFGSPVPGYQPPQETIEPSNRPVRVAAAILADAVAAGALRPAPGERLPRATREEMSRIRDELFPGLPEPVVFRAVTIWAMLFGSIGFEMFGRYGPILGDPAAILDHQLTEMADYIGLR
jgi:hypothetical protein